MSAADKCNVCGARLLMHRLRCPVCRAVNAGAPPKAKGGDGVVTLAQIKTEAIERYMLGIGEIDKNFGSGKTLGIARASVTLLGGGPGAGKSTLCLQLMARFAAITGRSPLYVGAEESAAQVKDRAFRLKLPHLDRIELLPLEAQADANLASILETRRPCACIVDSAQAFADDQGEAVRICQTLKLQSERLNSPFIIIGQLNKAEDFEGMKKLQHAVDTLCFFRMVEEIELDDGTILKPEGDEPFRELQTDKNRFGASGHTSYFTMGEKGLKGFVLPETA